MWQLLLSVSNQVRESAERILAISTKMRISPSDDELQGLVARLDGGKAAEPRRKGDTSPISKMVSGVEDLDSRCRHRFGSLQQHCRGGSCDLDSDLDEYATADQLDRPHTRELRIAPLQSATGHSHLL